MATNAEPQRANIGQGNVPGAEMDTPHDHSTELKPESLNGKFSFR